MLGSSHYVNVSVASSVLELYCSVNESIEGVVLAHAHVLTWAVNGAALTADDVTGLCELPTKKFHSESLAVRLTSVLRTTYTFFMCHNEIVFRG